MSEWWRNAVLYEIYVRSFADSDGDGVGDLEGIRQRLPYMRDLGVDGIWLTPFYPSPGADHGYDVSDYVGVDPAFGSLETFDALVADAHALDLRVVVDLVPNHSSIAHPWFREHPEYYVWRGSSRDVTPNNWLSIFGGPAWSWDEERGAWYLHLFAPEQPDLDWHNPEVRREWDAILRFWLDRGVDGCRVDVAHGLFKDPELRDEDEPVPGAEPRSFDRRRAIDRPEVHGLYREWRQLVDDYGGERMLLGEVFLTDPARVAAYVRPDELHLAFNFVLLWQPWEAPALRAAIDATIGALDAVGATPTWVLENHDVQRLPTRYGSAQAARAAALLLLALPGTAFVYQGEELGLEEVDLPDDVRQDPVFHRTGGERLGRDGCRVPFPWDRSAPALGFSTGTPWLPQPQDWLEQTVSVQKLDLESSLRLHRRALNARRELSGPLEWVDSPDGTLVFRRGAVTCAVNVDAPALELPAGEVLVATAPGSLPPASAAWVRTA